MSQRPALEGERDYMREASDARYGAGSGYRGIDLLQPAGGYKMPTQPFDPNANNYTLDPNLPAYTPTPNESGNGSGFNMGNILNTGLDYYQNQQGVDAARAAGERALGTAVGIGEQAAGLAEFKPYTVTSGLATGTTTPEGGLDLQLSAEEQARQNQYLGQSQSMFGGLSGDVAGGSQAIYEQMRAAQRPEEERQRLRMQEGLFSSGRGGLQSGMYGGGNAETFGFEQARQEAMLNSQLAARGQFGKEQAQMLQSAQGLQTAGYNPQRQALDLFAGANAPASYADAARRQQGSLFGNAAISGVEGFLQGEDLANRLSQQQMDALRTSVMGTGGAESLFGYGMDAAQGLWDEYGFGGTFYDRPSSSNSTIGGTGMTSGGNSGSSQAGSYTGGGTGMSRGGDADGDGVLNVSDRYPLDKTRS